MKLAWALVFSMACLSKLHVIERSPTNRQFYMICPAPLAAALEMEKGEQLGRVIKDRNTLDPSGGAPVQGQRRPLMSSDFGVLPGMESGAAGPGPHRACPVWLSSCI